MKVNLYGHKVNQLARCFNKKLNEKISPLGLYTSQCGIVTYLYEKKQCTQVELSRYLCVEPPTITRTLTRMEKMGWVVRQEGKDKRERYLTLTEKAYEMFPKFHEAFSNVETNALKDITKEELDIFNDVLEKMMTNLERG